MGSDFSKIKPRVCVGAWPYDYISCTQEPVFMTSDMLGMVYHIGATDLRLWALP